MVIPSADDWICIFVFFVVEMQHPAQVLYSSGFFCVSSHYLILPRVISLVVQGIGVSAPTPKVQSLISGQEQRLHKWFVMVLSEIKTNIQNQETRDEPETNGVTKSGK